MSLSMFNLTGRVAIVTGGGRGIGRAIALGFAEAGADVVVCARTTAEIEDTAAKIEVGGRKALAITTDVQNVDQVTNMLHKTLDLFSRVDILVNNAGGSDFSGQTLGTSVDAWEAMIKENLSSTFICSKTIGAVMVEQRTGSIINISSLMGVGPSPLAAAYGAAKAGIINLTKTLAQEWGQYNIRVNAIAPGCIETPVIERLYRENPKLRQARLETIPLGRIGKPVDIVGVAILLASDASAYITGETIEVGGGLRTLHLINN